MCSVIEKYKPTLLIDQAERMPKNEHSDLMACILSSYRTGLGVTIQVQGEAADRPIYGPKALALLGDMMAAARGRSIVIPMRAMRTRRRWRRAEAKVIGEQINEQCVALMHERTDDIDEAIANFAGLDFLEGREDEIWTPVFVMCDLFCPERRIELERAAADICAAKRAEPKNVSAAEAKRRSDNVRDGERLVRDLLVLCGDESGIRTGEALTKLKEIHNAPWRNYVDEPEGLTAIKMSQLLKLPHQTKAIQAAGQERAGLPA